MSQESVKICKNIRALCKSKKIGLGDLERSVGYATGYISRLEKGNKKISVDRACNIAQIFGVSLDDLINKDYEFELKDPVEKAYDILVSEMSSYKYEIDPSEIQKAIDLLAEVISY